MANNITITNLRITAFRALKDKNINFDKELNVISGKNGLGKSSILDAIRFLFFNKNSEGKKADNYKTFVDGEKKEEPILSLSFIFKEEQHILEHDKGTWFCDGIKFHDFENYNKNLQKIFKTEMENLFLDSNPQLLVSKVVGATSKNKELRDVLILILNSNLSEDKKINDEQFNDLLDEIEDEKNNIKMLRKTQNGLKQEIENFKKNNPEIKNWDSLDTIKDIQVEYSSIDDKIKNYNETRYKIELKEDEIKKINSKIFDIENKIKMNEEHLSKIQNELINTPKSIINGEITDNKTFNNKQSTIKLKWFEIILSILTLGIYYLIWKFFINKQTNTISHENINRCDSISNEINKLEKNEQEIKNNIVNIQYEKKELENARSKIMLERSKLSDSIKNIDFESLMDKKSEIESQIQGNENINIIKGKYNIKKEELNKLSEELADSETKFNKLSSKHRQISEFINKQLKSNFKTFEVSLFDSKSKEKTSVTQNGIDLKYLNFANKMNIVFELNEFLKKSNKNNVNSFVLIDQAESYNKINIENKGSQIIACKVTNDRELKNNGNFIS